MSKSLPEWNKLTNEVGTEFNEFNIIRGKEFISYGKDIWIGYFCFIDGSGGLEVGDNVTFSSEVLASVVKDVVSMLVVATPKPCLVSDK